jgi:dephospho-CoA kinase
MSAARMIVVGIVGGVASGKSFVCKEFEKLGARCLRADEVGHQVLEDSTVQQILCERWGTSILDARKQIDRTAVARIVFSTSPTGAQERRFLEQVTHPRISQRLQTQLQLWREQGDVQVVLLDAALLLEAGWDRWCQALVFVESTWEQRVSRVAQRGWTPDQLQAREAAQLPLNEKRSRATHQLDNTGSTTHTINQVQRIWQSLKPNTDTNATTIHNP